MENTNGHAEEKVSELDGAAPDSTDSALYFCTYAYLFHQVSHRLVTQDDDVLAYFVLFTDR